MFLSRNVLFSCARRESAGFLLSDVDRGLYHFRVSSFNFRALDLRQLSSPGLRLGTSKATQRPCPFSTSITMSHPREDDLRTKGLECPALRKAAKEDA